MRCQNSAGGTTRPLFFDFFCFLPLSLDEIYFLISSFINFLFSTKFGTIDVKHNDDLIVIERSI